MPPLINMLSHKDAQLKEMAAFALGRLAQAVDNQAGIVQASMLHSALQLCWQLYQAPLLHGIWRRQRTVKHRGC